MKLWKRATAALKDQNSIIVANLSRRSPYRIPDLEACVIKATSHDESHVDYKNAERVFAWLRTLPVSLKPLIWILTKRMEKTRSWVVAIKGLMLMHGIFCCKNPSVLRIGRLPFDLSNFQDGHSKGNEMWGFNAFVRAYYAFLDQRSLLLFEQKKHKEPAMVQELSRLQNWQTLLDILLQVKPVAENMKEVLILEAMDCVIIEIFDIYSRICNAIARVLVGIYKAGKLEAIMALKVLRKATAQAEELASYFQFCRDFGVLNAMEVPKVTQIPEKDIKDLERIINGVSTDNNREKTMVVREDDGNSNKKANVGSSKSELRTIITDKWEVFEEEFVVSDCNHRQEDDNHSRTSSSKTDIINFQTPPHYLPLVPVYKEDYVPDLISF